MATGVDCATVLGPLGFPEIILKAWEQDGVKDLLPIQLKAVQTPAFFDNSTLVIGPTTCGKTFAGELACVKHLLSHRKCLYLVPFKAIAEEKYQEFTRKYGGEPLEARILISTADRRDQDRTLGDGDFHIAILTYEKLSAIIVTHPNLLNNVGAVVVDEIQMLAENGVASKIIEEKFSASAGRARQIGAYCSWVAAAAAKIAWTLNRPEEAKQYERIAERFLYGCTDKALLVASASDALHRAEREQLASAGFDSLIKIVQTSAVEIAKTAKIDRRHVEDLQKDIIDLVGQSLGIEQRQIARLTAMGKPTKNIEEMYALKGTALEQAIEEILTPPFCPLAVSRITPQREGEADLKFVLSSGQHGIAQITAKDLPTDKVGINKSISILTQSPELKPKVYICFGRPDFLPDAVKKANEHANNGHNIKLIPLYVLAEMYVLFHEGKLSATRVVDILEKRKGYIDLKALSLT